MISRRLGPPLRVRIVGGSLGGLSTAALLHRDGHDVQIFERSKDGLGGRGAGLSSQPDLVEIFHAVGLSGLVNLSIEATERVTINRYGSIVSSSRSWQLLMSWDHIYRAFRALLPQCVYRLDAEVEGVSQTPNEAVIRLKGGEEEHADILIGADGIGSVVRPSITGQIAPVHYAGYCAWRGRVDEDRISQEAAALLFGRFAFYYPVSSQILGYPVPGPSGELHANRRRYNWVWYRRRFNHEIVGRAWFACYLRARAREDLAAAERIKAALGAR